MIYNTYLFDMDGTLLDTLADLTAAVNHTLEQYGYPRRTIEPAGDFSHISYRLGNCLRT